MSGDAFEMSMSIQDFCRRIRPLGHESRGALVKIVGRHCETHAAQLVVRAEAALVTINALAEAAPDNETLKLETIMRTAALAAIIDAFLEVAAGHHLDDKSEDD